MKYLIAKADANKSVEKPFTESTFFTVKSTPLSLFLCSASGTRVGDLAHVPVVEDLAQVDAKINNLAAGAPRGRIQL